MDLGSWHGDHAHNRRLVGRVEGELGVAKKHVRTLVASTGLGLDTWPLAAIHIGERRLRGHGQSKLLMQRSERQARQKPLWSWCTKWSHRPKVQGQVQRLRVRPRLTRSPGIPGTSSRRTMPEKACQWTASGRNTIDRAIESRCLEPGTSSSVFPHSSSKDEGGVCRIGETTIRERHLCSIKKGAYCFEPGKPKGSTRRTLTQCLGFC